MLGFYIASAIIGWAFVGLFLFGGLDSDVDADLDGETEYGAGAASGIAAAALSLLSFRSIVFFLAFFGLTGILLDVFDAGGVMTLFAALGVGAFAWVFNSFVFRALKVADVSSSLRPGDLLGAIGEVVLPISPGHRGRIAVEVNDQRRYLTAEPHAASQSASHAVGETVVVVEMNKGTARVAPLNALDT